MEDIIAQSLAPLEFKEELIPKGAVKDIPEDASADEVA